MSGPQASPRVLVLTPDFPPAFGGIQLLMHRLVANWARVEARVVTLDAPGAAAFDRDEPLPPARVRCHRALGLTGLIGTLNARSVLEAARFRPAVVLSGHINASPAAWIVERLLGAPYVQYLHGREAVIRPRLTAFGLSHASAVVAVSAYTRDLALSHGARPASIHRIPPGVDVTEESPQNGRRTGRPTVVTVARLEQRYKGHDVLLRALPLVRSRIPDVELVIVGDGPLREACEELSSALGLEASVRFAGPLDDAARNEVLSRSHVFAMPSRLPIDGGGEGFGIVYLEAGIHGLPVVAGDVGGALDAVVHGETGVLVDPADHVAVAEAIADLLADPARAEALGRAARERALSLAWPAIARRVEDVLLDVASSR
ncbi:MAG: glycosyltransferase family 4 protein [Actinobacteria bacterium]|nr:glycosyltransferase family 4 protein [Actinomycetota bacterium]